MENILSTAGPAEPREAQLEGKLHEPAIQSNMLLRWRLLDGRVKPAHGEGRR